VISEFEVAERFMKVMKLGLVVLLVSLSGANLLHSRELTVGVWRSTNEAMRVAYLRGTIDAQKELNVILQGKDELVKGISTTLENCMVIKNFTLAGLADDFTSFISKRKRRDDERVQVVLLAYSLSCPVDAIKRN
jgi:hypothetical protein